MWQRLTQVGIAASHTGASGVRGPGLPPEETTVGFQLSDQLSPDYKPLSLRAGAFRRKAGVLCVFWTS